MGWIINRRRETHHTQVFAFDIPLEVHDEFIGVLSLISDEQRYFRTTIASYCEP